MQHINNCLVWASKPYLVLKCALIIIAYYK